MKPARMAKVFRAAAERIVEGKSFACCPAIGTSLWIMHREDSSAELIRESAATIEFFLGIFRQPGGSGMYLWANPITPRSQLERSLALLLAAEMIEGEL